MVKNNNIPIINMQIIDKNGLITDTHQHHLHALMAMVNLGRGAKMIELNSQNAKGKMATMDNSHDGH